MRHKKFLKQLERQKNVERDENMMMMAEKENKTAKFKEAAARQRTKIKGLKQVDVQEQNADMMMMEEEAMQPLSANPQPLTAANLAASERS